jgi:CubicO group peptidase (beta-lactamase class C family)
MKFNSSELQREVAASLTRHRVPGASIAVLRDGELLSAAAGLTNVNTSVGIDTQTVMHIGSITKVFTATLVMKLVDAGKVHLDEPVLRYLPDLRLQDRAALEQITVKMLLNHTSGIDGELLPDHGHDEETIEKSVLRMAHLGQLFRPGTEFSYCNCGTVIAGYLAQRVTGKSWYRLMRDEIFTPLGMQHAAALPEEALLHRASVGHFRHPASHQLTRTSNAFLPLSFSPAGSTLMMSAADLVTFAGNGVHLLSADAGRSMQEMTVDNRGKGYTYTDGMGLGWMLLEGGALYHGGGGPGIVAVLYAAPKRACAVAILTNAAHGLGVINDLLSPWLGDLGLTQPVGALNARLPAEPVRIDSSRYEGVYEDLMHRYRVVALQGELALSKQSRFAGYEYVSTEPAPAVRLAALDDSSFLLDSSSAADSGSSAASRLFTFRGQDDTGHMRYLGNGLRLYPRVA